MFISPERLRTDSFLELLKGNQIPPIIFACIDEVHCMSEWSHNFRTSYLHLPNCLSELFDVDVVLSMTGTATASSQQVICEMLSICQETGIISSGCVRDNLLTNVTRVDEGENRDLLLFELLRSEPYRNLKSIIVYCTFQAQADKLAQYLHTRNIDAESYHAGKQNHERHRIQAAFLGGKLRIIVATVAFGLGINKADVDSVIHFSLPKTVENYVQEIGRAGRDGRQALCHLFLAKEDYIKLRSFAFADLPEDSSIKLLLAKLFPLIQHASRGESFVSLSIEECEKELDMKNTTLSTILSYIALEKPRLLELYPGMSY